LAGAFGCSKDTIRNYEAGRSMPEVRHWPAVLRFLGYDPRPEPASWPERLRFVREGRGLTQGELASLLGVDIRTVNAWEKGHGRPARRTATALQAFLAG
jgi:DNA-binding transcriptional regulator YiaG